MNQFLTNREQQILDFITDEIDRTGIAPTHFQIASAFEIPSLKIVSQYLKVLEQKGWIACQPLDSRGISLTENVPHYRIAFGGEVNNGRVALKKAI